MANTLRYTYQIKGGTWNDEKEDFDMAPITFDNVNAAKGMMDFSECDFTGLSPVYSLEDSDKTLVVTIPFADTADGRTAQDAFHNNMKDTWTVTGSIDGSTVAETLQPSNSFTVTSIKDGEVDLNA